MNKNYISLPAFSWFLIIAVSFTACLSYHMDSGDSLTISGDFFGQPAPGDSARLFAPGIICTGMDEYGA